MNIGLYGDSFSTSHQPAKHFAWYNLLAEKLGGKVYNYINHMDGESYGLGASSTYWSYKRFLKYHHLHDINIFIASNPTKYPKLLNLRGDGNLCPLSGINSLEWYIHDERVTDEGRDTLEKIKSWYLVNDEEFMWDAHELMLQDIERTTQKPLYILSSECGGISLNEERRKKNNINFGLWDVAFLAQKSLGCYGMNCTLNERQTMIAAHLPEETSVVFADLMYDYIVHGTKIVLPKYISHKHSYTEYYIGCE